MVQVGDGIWFETVSGVESVENATCSNNTVSIDLLSSRPISQWSDDELGTTIFLYALLKEVADAEICLLYDQVADGALLARAFSVEGAELLTLYEGSEVGMLATHAEVLKRIARSN